MKISLEQRIPDPSTKYAYKNIIVEGDENEKLTEELLKKTSEWRKLTEENIKKEIAKRKKLALIAEKEKIQKLADSKTADTSSGEVEKENVSKSPPANQEQTKVENAGGQSITPTT